MALARDLLQGGAGRFDASESRNLESMRPGPPSSPSSTVVSPEVRGGAPPIEEKRVRNTRIKEELGVRLTFPTFREGIGSIHRGEIGPFSGEDLTMLQGGGGAARDE